MCLAQLSLELCHPKFRPEVVSAITWRHRLNLTSQVSSQASLSSLGSFDVLKRDQWSMVFCQLVLGGNIYQISTRRYADNCFVAIYACFLAILNRLKVSDEINTLFRGVSHFSYNLRRPWYDHHDLKYTNTNPLKVFVGRY